MYVIIIQGYVIMTLEILQNMQHFEVTHILKHSDTRVFKGE